MLRNKEYGQSKQCEIDGCEHTRGASLRSEYYHGCVLCVSCENKRQLGNLELPDSTSNARKQKAANKILG